MLDLLHCHSPHHYYEPDIFSSNLFNSSFSSSQRAVQDFVFASPSNKRSVIPFSVFRYCPKANGVFGCLACQTRIAFWGLGLHYLLGCY